MEETEFFEEVDAKILELYEMAKNVFENNTCIKCNKYGECNYPMLCLEVGVKLLVITLNKVTELVEEDSDSNFWLPGIRKMLWEHVKDRITYDEMKAFMRDDGG